MLYSSVKYCFNLIQGQLFFSWGIEAKSFGLMCVGRALFGVGGESLFVSQTRMTTTWFKGKELSFALGINLAMARMGEFERESGEEKPLFSLSNQPIKPILVSGSVLNDFLSPLLGIHHSIPFAMWIGFLTCVASFLCSCYLGYIDSKYDPINGMKRIPSCVPSSSSSSSLLQRRSSRVGRQRHRKHGSAGGDLDSSALLDQLAEEDGIHDEDNDDIFIHQDGSTTTTAEYIDLQEIIPHNSSSFSPSFSSSPTSRLHSHHHHLMKPPTSLSSLLDFPFPFWLIIIAMNLMYATVIPFNTIHSAFLQTKWYKGNPQIAAQVMAVPDTISAVFVPFAGTFADMYGHRVKTLMLCGLVMSVCHLVLGLGTVTTVASPMPALVAMGAGYCLLLTFWPCISLCVRDDRLASAM